MQALVSKLSVFAAGALAIAGAVAAAPAGSADGGLTTAGPDPSDAGAPDVLPTDSEGVGFVQDDGSVPLFNSPDIFQYLCVTDPHVTSFDYSAVKPPYTDVAGCKAFNADAGFAAGRACSCDNCFSIMQQCDGLVGCQQIVSCALKAGCVGSEQCYAAANAPCYDVINSYSSGGLESNLSGQLGTCTTMFNCPMN